MSLSALVVAVLLILIGYIILLILQAVQIGVPAIVQKLFVVIVALIALYMLVALLLGMPALRIIGRAGGYLSFG